MPTNKLTDTVTAGGFKVKINSVTLPFTAPASAQFKPSDPMEAMVIDFTATNVTDKPLGFSSIMGMELYDSEKNKYLASVVYEDIVPKSKLFPDTPIDPNKSATGEIVFEVPKTAKGYLLFVEGALFHRTGPTPVIDLGR